MKPPYFAGIVPTLQAKFNGWSTMDKTLEGVKQM